MFAKMTPDDLDAFFGGEPLTQVVSLAKKRPTIVRNMQYQRAIKTRMIALTMIRQAEKDAGLKFEKIIPNGTVRCYDDHVAAIIYLRLLL